MYQGEGTSGNGAELADVLEVLVVLLLLLVVDGALLLPFLLVVEQAVVVLGLLFRHGYDRILISKLVEKARERERKV